MTPLGDVFVVELEAFVGVRRTCVTQHSTKVSRVLVQSLIARLGFSPAEIFKTRGLLGSTAIIALIATLIAFFFSTRLALKPQSKHSFFFVHVH